MTRPNFTLRIDPSDLTRLRALQKETGATVAEHVRRSIKHYLSSMGPASREMAGLLHGSGSFAKRHHQASKVQKRRRS